MASTVDETIALLAATPALVRSCFSGLSDDSLMSSEPDVWGARQVLEHLIDAETIAFRERIGRILEEDRPLIRSIDPPARLEQGGYAARSLEELLAQFEALRAESTTWLRSIDEGDFGREGEHEDAGTIRVGELIHYWAAHDLTHLSQMTTALRETLLPYVGNMHRFLEELR